MSVIKLIIILGIISAIVIGFIIFPAEIENVAGIKNVTTENYKIASNYGDIDWNIVVPLNASTFILEKDGIVKFIKVANKSAEPIEIRTVKVFDEWECKTVNGKLFKVNYTVYECEPVKVKLAFINITANNWKLGTIGIFFKKDIIYVVSDTFAKNCSPIVNKSSNCSKSKAELIAKIKIGNILIENKMISDNKLNILLNNSLTYSTF